MEEPTLQTMIDQGRFDAFLFDLDGVLTSTAEIHSTCWKEMFDAFLDHYRKAAGTAFEPFDMEKDYKLHVDGKLRYEGVRSFLQSRGIHLPYGSPDEPPNFETICGLGNMKNRLVGEVLESRGVRIYEKTVSSVRGLRARGIRTAVVSASRNCRTVLRLAGITDLFDVRVDGEVAGELELPGKPAPDTFLKAAELLGVPPERAVVVEDAISGVQAGRNGGFGLVIGIDRTGNAEGLKENGAHLVAADFGDLLTN